MSEFVNNGGESVLDELELSVYIADTETHELLFVNRAGLRDLGCGTYTGCKCFETVYGRTSPCPFCNIGQLRPGQTLCWDHHNDYLGRTYRLQDKLIQYGGRPARLEIAIDVTDREIKQRELQNILDREERLAGAVQILNGAGGIGLRLNTVLKNIGGYFGADRSYIFLPENGGRAVRRAYEWCRDGVEPHINDLQNRDIHYMDRWMPYFLRQQVVIIPDTEAISSSRQVEYDIISRQGIRSYIKAPIFEDGVVTGFIGIDNPEPDKARYSGDLMLSLSYSVASALIRAKDEENLIDTRRRYELAVESAGLGVWEYDIKNHKISSPSHSFKQFGVRDEISGVPESILPMFSEEDRPKLLDMFRRIETGEPMISEEFWMNWQPDSPPRCERVIYSVVRDETGMPVTAYGIGMNVTAQRQEQEKFKRSIRSILSANPNALCTFRLNLTKNTCSEEHGTSTYIQNLLQGDTVDELFGNIVSIITEPGDQEAFNRTFSRGILLYEYISGKTQIALKYHRKVDNGESHMVQTYINMLQNPETGDIEAVAYSADMEREEKEEKVISAITNREYDYIALIDVKSARIHYQYISPKAISTVHLKMGDYATVMRDALSVLVNPDEAEEHLSAIDLEKVRSALADKAEYSYSFPCHDGAGRLYRKQLSYRYLDSKRDEILFFRSDITELFRQEQERAERLRKALLEARHASAMKSEFLSNVSHDMRTPLNAVLGYANLALQSEDRAAVSDYLGKISKAGNILLSLINDTLDLSKIETGAVTLKPAPIGCGEVISKIVSAIRPSIDEKHIHFVIDNSRAVMATINLDALRVQEIFINLLSNAVKFTPEGGEIVLVVECVNLRRDLVSDRITVRDTGCGISSDFLPKIFEPFAQERQPETADVGGSGLGLSIVRRLVDLMGGTIEVHSELGAGTEFIVNLDFERVDDELADTSSQAASYDRLSGRRVLLCEDNAMNREIAKALLEMRGMSVVFAENGLRGLEAFTCSEPGTFDAILMDIRMPVMDGHEASSRIRRSAHPDARSIPIIAMSADAYDDDVRRSAASGMNSHISKPIDPDLLYGTLCKLIN